MTVTFIKLSPGYVKHLTTILIRIDFNRNVFYCIKVNNFLNKNVYLHDQCMDFHQNLLVQNRDSRFVVGERNCQVVNILRYLSALWNEILLSTVSLRANFPLKRIITEFFIATSKYA